MKILVSSCLLGEDVRFDGDNSSIAYSNKLRFSEKEIFMDLMCENEIYSFCPEVEGGLTVPRIPAQITSFEKPFKVTNEKQEDVTINFLLGAKKTLDLCLNEDIKVALLKAKSPSCGNIETYDGTFTKTLINKPGLTAKLLMENGITIFNENQLNQLKEFIKKS
ncbi:MAG: Uncharacterised protein [Arcobacter lacus]|nr:MAG: Uncharacterised protein [Arcobacter lacus]